MRFLRPVRLALLAATAVCLTTCTEEAPTLPDTEGAELATAGAPARVTISRQPPASALDQEVWSPGVQPIALVKDAAKLGVPGVVVTATLASGTGVLQGTLTATTRANGSAQFTDLGISGTGPHTLRFSTDSIGVTSNTVNLNPLPPEANTGQWGSPVDWDIVPLHMTLLPTGKILAWGKYEADGTMARPRLWDPAAGLPTTAITVAPDTTVFCGGHTLMADGRVMVAGGHKSDDRGLDETNIFDPVTESWVPGLARMAQGRWYPSVTTLPDGRMVTIAGRDSNSVVVQVPEIWESDGWVQLPGANLKLPYYPRMFVAPNGKLFYAGEAVKARWLDVDVVTTKGRGRWTTSTGLTHLWGFNRDYGSAVMYETGKIIFMGGGGNPVTSVTDPRSSVPTETAETIDLNVSGPAWHSTGSMNHGRRHLNATVLPDGEVLVTGGTSGGGFNDLSAAVHAAELWDPKTGVWTELAANSIDRAYHSVSLLLPDGTVLHGASGDPNALGTTTPFPQQKNHEIFSPPYLFRGVRPTIGGLSKSAVSYGEIFTVTTPNAAQVTEVRWIRLGSVTHAFDTSQRANSLKFSRGSGTVRVTAPATSGEAPPGYYQLFILNRNHVPSNGSVVQLR